MVNHPSTYSINTLYQLKAVLSQLLENDFNASLEILSNNTIGKHCRHILEFYDCLLSSKTNEIVNYDHRLRNVMLESNLQFCLERCDLIIQHLGQNTKDYTIQLQTEYGNQSITIQSNYYRELIYNIEHTIHHFAIIAIAIKNHFKYVKIPDNFGIAESTIKFQQSAQCAQ